MAAAQTQKRTSLMIQSYQLPDNPIHIKLYIFTNEKVQRNPPPLKKKAGMQGPLPVSSLCVNNSSANLSTQISSTIQGFFSTHTTPTSRPHHEPLL